MKPIKFKHQNVLYDANLEEYPPIPALRISSGEVISSWKLSFWERIKCLITGKIWICQSMIDNPGLTPIVVTLNRKELYTHPDDSLSFIQKLTKWLKLKSTSK